MASPNDEIFARSIDELLQNPNLIAPMQAKLDLSPVEIGLERAPSRAPRSNTPISDRAKQLIIACEISSKSRYESLYQSPIWPRGQSGVTIGIGYDLGYVSADNFFEDWSSYIPNDQIALLSNACGITGVAAAALAQRMQEVSISWPPASEQFYLDTLPRYVGETERALQNTELLSPDCLGALVSLVYNRGASFRARGDRYTEMRSIRTHMTNRDFAKIPGEITAMKRIWRGNPDMRGVLLRRDSEAALFASGLRS